MKIWNGGFELHCWHRGTMSFALRSSRWEKSYLEITACRLSKCWFLFILITSLHCCSMSIFNRLLIDLSSFHLFCDLEGEHGQIFQVDCLLHIRHCLSKLALVVLHLLRFLVRFQSWSDSRQLLWRGIEHDWLVDLLHCQWLVLRFQLIVCLKLLFELFLRLPKRLLHLIELLLSALLSELLQLCYLFLQVVCLWNTMKWMLDIK